MATTDPSTLTDTQQATAAAAIKQGIGNLAFDSTAAAANTAAQQQQQPQQQQQKQSPISSAITTYGGMGLSAISLLGASSLSYLPELATSATANGAMNAVMTNVFNLTGLGQIFGVASIALSTYQMFSAIGSGNWGQFFLAAGTEFLSLVKLVGPLGAAFAVVGSMVIAGIATGIKDLVNFIFGGESEAEQALNNFDNLTVWSSSQVLSLLSAAAFLNMGYNIDNAVSNLNGQGMMVPTSTLNQLLTNNLANTNGSAYMGGIPYGVPIVLGGPNGNTEVMIVSQSGIQNGKAMDSVMTYNLANNMTFAASKRPDGAYIPIELVKPDGSKVINPQAVTAINNQRAILTATATGSLTAASAANGVSVAGASDKLDIQSLSSPSPTTP